MQKKFLLDQCERARRITTEELEEELKILERDASRGDKYLVFHDQGHLNIIVAFEECLKDVKTHTVDRSELRKFVKKEINKAKSVLDILYNKNNELDCKETELVHFNHGVMCEGWDLLSILNKRKYYSKNK